MAIVKMKKLRVMAMADRREALLRALLRLGCVEISEPDGLLEDPAWSALLQRGFSRLADTKTEINGVNIALEAIRHYAGLKDGLFIKRHPISEEEFLSTGTAERAKAVSREIGEQLQTLTRLQSEENRLTARQASLLPWQAMDMPLELSGTEHVLFRPGVMPAGVDVGQIQVSFGDPAASMPKVQALLEKEGCAWEAADPTPEEYPEVPVQLKNNWLTRPLNMVTEMYSLPAYDNVDPNPLMAPFFILFYGVMMADMGYGILMILAGILITRAYRPKGTAGNLFNLMTLCGITTFVMGAVTGGFFGDFLTQLVKLATGRDFALPALFTPLDDTLMILVGAMCLGFVQIVVGMAISFVQKLKKGQVLDAILEEVTWWVVFAGIALMVLKVTNLVLYAGLVLVVAGPLITGKGFGKVTGIFASLYNHVTGYFGDVLSYSRLMALMLAGSVIAQVFNTLGAIPGNIVVFFIISMAGNALNFALNLLGCYVHDLRLQCLEYFGKFYEDGGKPFRPLAINTKYVDIENV